ncbi:MAG: HD domain-containing protein [Deltaproteobacteria bacterium]|nr:MAG: HD domain-containing protein [Deltaproteobacteria bacterium]
MELPNIIPVPSLEECLTLMDTHGMLPNIREHSFRVSRVAVFLGEALAQAGHSLNLPLIETGALLHDLGKTPCLGTSRNHALWGAEILRDLGYHEVAQVVAEHVYLKNNNGGSGFFREAEVVNYADKRVLHTRVVTLSQRFIDLHERYGRTPEARARIAVNQANTRVLEEKLFAPLDLAPEDLLQLNQWREQ